MNGTGEICDECGFEIMEDEENGSFRCGCCFECPCGCDGDETICVYAKRAAKPAPVVDAATAASVGNSDSDTPRN